jgi:hypothetical protein
MHEERSGRYFVQVFIFDPAGNAAIAGAYESSWIRAAYLEYASSDSSRFRVSLGRDPN